MRKSLHVLILVMAIFVFSGCSALGGGGRRFSSLKYTTEGIDATSITAEAIVPVKYQGTSIEEDLAALPAPKPFVDTYDAKKLPPLSIKKTAIKKTVVKAHKALPVFKIIPRSSWSRRSPNSSRLAGSGRFWRLTVHHEGIRPVTFSSWSRTVRELRNIQKAHMGKRTRMGDIGYHFIVDRAGRIWGGRSLEYRGAHTRGANKGNIGVMVLGNFEKQYPTKAQFQALDMLVTHLVDRYSINPKHVYGHRDLGESACPGKYLYSMMNNLTCRRRMFASSN